MRTSLLLVLLGAGCGGGSTTPPPVDCNASTCTGCCKNNTCLTGAEGNACGSGGNQCADCGSNRFCIDAVCQVEPLPAGAKLAFVTRTTFKGNLGGLAGADQLCDGAAQAGTLPGRFKAWLSTNRWDDARNAAVYVHAVDRFTSNGPWYLPGVGTNGRRLQVFASRAAMRSAPLVPIDRTELGMAISTTGRNVYTGTQATGMSLPVTRFSQPVSTCANWTLSSGDTATIGSVYGQGGDWTALSDSQRCDADFSLYCFED